MAARLHIILLDQPAAHSINVLFWLDVPPGREIFHAKDGKSQWLGATDADNLAITTGTVVEEAHTFQPDVLPGLPQMQSLLQAMWTAAQNRCNNFNPGPNYGSFFDGTSWTMVTIP